MARMWAVSRALSIRRCGPVDAALFRRLQRQLRLRRSLWNQPELRRSFEQELGPAAACRPEEQRERAEHAGSGDDDRGRKISCIAMSDETVATAAAPTKPSASEANASVA